MIDTTHERLITLAEACRLVPAARNGRKTHLSTLIRWITSGACNPNGELVRLEGLRVGSRWATSREALQRFFERLTPTLDAPGVPTPRTPTQRRRASERATNELDKMGI